MNADLAPVEDKRRYFRYYTYVEPLIADPVVRGYFALVASMFLAAFFIVFALSPTITTILGLTRKIDDQKKLLAQMDGKINSLIIAQEKYSAAEPLLPLLDSSLPEKPAPETILTGILTAASQSGVKVSSVQFGDVILSPNASESAEAAKTAGGQSATSVLPRDVPAVRFSVGVSAEEAKIHDFMNRLLVLPRLITLSDLSVAPGGAGVKGTGTITADIIGVGYYLKL